MADLPSDIRSSPEYLTGINPVKVPHRPFERHSMPAVVANDSFGITSGPRRVEDIERVTGFHRNTFNVRALSNRVIPVDITRFHQLGPLLGPLQNDTVRGLRARLLDGTVQHRLVGTMRLPSIPQEHDTITFGLL